MGRNNHDARRPSEAIDWLPRLQYVGLYWAMELMPTKTTRTAYASVCLWYVGSKKTRVMLGRWGEAVNPISHDQVLSAWLRAAVKGGAFVEASTEDELIKLAEWELDMRA